MKKREIVITLIAEFILQKPGRSFKEIEEFAKTLGASYIELKEAVLTIQYPSLPTKQKLTMRIRSITNSIAWKMPPVSIKRLDIKESLVFARSILIPMFSFASLIIIIISTLTLSTHRPVSKSIKSLSTSVASTSVTPTPKVSSAIFTPPVYANQKKINPQRVFSYPGSSISLAFSGVPRKEVLGFLPYWMLDVASEIHLDGMTSISLFGLTPDENGNIITFTNDQTVEPGWEMWNSSALESFIYQAKKKRIKLFLTFKSFDATIIEHIVTSDEAQRTLIANAIQLVNSKSLDGINIDFEYIGDASPLITSGFTRLIANLNAELKRQVPNAQLSVDTYLHSGALVNFFDVQLLQQHVDAFIIMGYDVHSPVGQAGPIAPLEGGSSILGYMQSYLERIPPSKLILAVPYYGYDWPVGYAPNEEQSFEGTTISSDEVRILSYAEIAAEGDRYPMFWDETSQAPYYQYVDIDTSTLREVHFENIRSLALKYDYILNKDLKGVGIWAMGYDGLNQELQQLLLEKFAQ